MDPRKRLQLAQVSSPSLRVLAAPDAPAVSLNTGNYQVQDVPQLGQTQVANPQALKLQGQDDSQAIYDTSYANTQQQAPKESLASKIKNFVFNTGEGQFSKGIARVLPGGTQDLAANTEMSNQAANRAGEIAKLLRDGKISAAQAQKLIGLETQNADEAVKNQATIESDMPTRTQIGLGAATTAVDLIGGLVAKPLAAAGLGAAAGGLGTAATGGDAKDILINTALGGAGAGALAGAGKILESIAAKTNIPQDIIEHVVQSGDNTAIKAIADEAGMSDTEFRSLFKAGANDAVKNPSVSKEITSAFNNNQERSFSVAPGGETRVNEPVGSDSLNLAVTALGQTQNKGAIRNIVNNLLPDLQGTELNRLVRTIVKTDDPQKVADELYNASKLSTPSTPIESPVSPGLSPETAPNGAQVTGDATATQDITTPIRAKNGAQAPPYKTPQPIPAGVKSALDDVVNHVDTEAVKARGQTNKLYKQERAQRAAAFEEALANGEGDDAWKAAYGKLKGELPKGSYTPLEIGEDGRKAVDDFVKTLPGTYNKINLNNALRRVFGEDQGIPTPSDIRYIREAFGNDFADQINEHVAASKGWKDVLAEVLSTPKAALATGDLSASLRQGGVLGARFPSEWGSATKDMTRYAFSGKAYEDGMRQIADRPTYSLMERAKLAVDGARGLKGTEEEFRPSLLERKWLKKIGVGQITEGSDRAYSGFLTQFRADVFDTMVDKFQKSGIDLNDKQLKSIGKFINTATGRGDLGSAERYAGLLGQALFSPRLWKSRIDLINPIYYAQLTPEVRKYALQSTGNYLAAVGAVLGLAAAAGAKVSTDPASSDFAKIKVGNTRYDIMGGLQQNIVLAYRLLSGEKTNSETGEKATLGAGKNFGAPDRFDLLVDFFLNKANPNVSLGVKALKGEGPDGKPYNIAAETAKSLIPLNFQSIAETAKDSGSLTDPGNLGSAAAKTLPSFFGVGVNTYGKTSTKDQTQEPTDLAGKIQKTADDKAKTKTDFLATLSDSEKTLIGKSDDTLKQLREDGTIDDDMYRQITGLKKVQDNLTNGIKVPDNLKSDDAKAFYKKYNSLTKTGQEDYLKRSSPEAERLIGDINKQRPEGLPELKPSNKLAKLYSDFENDINKEGTTAVDKNNKVKTFYSNAVKSTYSDEVQKIFSEGGSADVKGLLADKTISEDDLKKAIEIDNALYDAGISTSLKFSKTFRKANGYAVPLGSKKAGTYDETSGSTKTPKEKIVNAHLADFLSSVGKTPKSPPRFSPGSTKTPKLNLPKLPSAPAKPKISIKL